MSQRLLQPRFVAVAGLVLACGSLVVVACSSEDRTPGADNGTLLPGAGGTDTQQPSAGGSGTDGSAGDGQIAANGGASSGGTEGQQVGLPIAGGANAGGNPGSGNGGSGGEGPTVDPVLPTANCAAPEGGVPNLALSLVTDDVNQPLLVTGVPGDDSRLFILQKNGAVRVMVNGVLEQTPFLNIANQITNAGERGLLGLAFHSDYASNGLFYLHFSSAGGGGLNAGTTVIAEYSVDPDNRSLGNAGSQRVVLTNAHPESNHNGGMLAFGPDGMLYFGYGDGGSQNDPDGNGQALDTLFAKILRLDPTGRAVNNAYSIPEGNLVAQDARGEIWAYGLRNPWRFSFDACNGDLYIGDVGQTAQEEIDYLPASTPAGTNFGWRIMEGPNCRPGEAGCQGTPAGLTLPVDAYGRGVGTSVTGGYVYRGSDVPGLRGTYIYADYNSARFFRFRIQNGQAVDKVEITDQFAGQGIDNISSFGQDNAGEMYVTTLTPGAVYRIVAAQ